jgi:four helix bundle protein
MADNIIKTKTYKFAVDIVNLYKYLVKEKREFGLSKQLLKSGTSIAANVREGTYAQSNADFIHKFSISQKEADETLFWLELLKDTEYISEETFDKYFDECTQIMKIISKIIITSKKK